LVLALLLTCGLSWGCGPGRKATAPPAALTATTISTLTATTPVTEPSVPIAKLQSILLTRADLPAGFARAPTTERGDTAAGGGLQACGQSAVDTSGAGAQVTQAFVRPEDHLRLVLYVIDFPTSTAASAPVVSLRSLGQQCHEAGLTARQPVAVGEEVAGLQQTGPAAAVDIALIRSGPVVAVIRLSGPAPGPALEATMDTVVRAVGTKLAVGTGG
jgi:hypothetical protein